MTIFWILAALLCLLNAADVITTHLIFKKSIYARELNPLLSWFVKPGSPFVAKLAILKGAVTAGVVVALWGGMNSLAGGTVLSPALLGLIDGFYFAIVAGNVEELLRNK